VSFFDFTDAPAVCVDAVFFDSFAFAVLLALVVAAAFFADFLVDDFLIAVFLDEAFALTVFFDVLFDRRVDFVAFADFLVFDAFLVVDFLVVAMAPIIPQLARQQWRS